MFKISPEYYKNTLNLYSKSEYDFLLIRAVLENKQRGCVWADDPVNPANFFVINNFGFCYLFGNNRNEDFEEFINALIFSESELQNNYLLWYSPPTEWEKKLDSLAGLNLKRRIRYQFKFDENTFRQNSNLYEKAPEGFRMEKITKSNLDSTEVFNLNLGRRFWKSDDDFLENGYGFCLKGEDGNFNSICYSACVVNNKAEIDVATLENFRGRNLATYCVKSFIDYSLHAGITPNWDCFESNIPSIKVAERLGFIPQNKYPLYSFNRNNCSVN